MIKIDAHLPRGTEGFGVQRSSKCNCGWDKRKGPHSRFPMSIIFSSSADDIEGEWGERDLADEATGVACYLKRGVLVSRAHVER